MAYHYLLNPRSAEARTCLTRTLERYKDEGWQAFDTEAERDAANVHDWMVDLNYSNVSRLTINDTKLYRGGRSLPAGYLILPTQAEAQAALLANPLTYDVNPHNGELTRCGSWIGDGHAGPYATWEAAAARQNDYKSFCLAPDFSTAECYADETEYYNQNGYRIFQTAEERQAVMPIRWSWWPSEGGYRRTYEPRVLRAPSRFANDRALFRAIRDGLSTYSVDRVSQETVEELGSLYRRQVRAHDGWNARQHLACFRHIDCFMVCDDCENAITHPNISDTINGRFVCGSCAGNYATCPECEEQSHTDAMRNRDGDWYCPECVPAREIPDGELLGYTQDVLEFKPGFRLALGEVAAPKPLWLGVELEVHPGAASNYIQSKAVRRAQQIDFAICKDDGSLKEDGFEIVTVPGSLRWYQETVKPWLQSSAGWYEGWNHRDCGMHVHVGKKELSPLTQGKLLVFMHDESNQPFLDHIAGRAAGQYCYRGDGKKKIPDYRREHTIGRYQGLNFRTRGYATIEFRIFRSNAAPHGFMRNVEFVHALVSWCRGASMRDVTEAQRGLKGAKGITGHRNLIDYVARNRAAYPSLVRWLEDQQYLQAPRGLELVPEKHRAAASAARYLGVAA